MQGNKYQEIFNLIFMQIEFLLFEKAEKNRANTIDKFQLVKSTTT